MSFRICLPLGPTGELACWDLPLFVPPPPPDPTEGPGPHPWVQDLNILTAVHGLVAELNDVGLRDAVLPIVSRGIGGLASQLTGGVQLISNDQHLSGSGH